MKFSYNWLKALSGFGGTAQKMAELLTLHVAEVDEVKKVGNDYVIDVALPANRVGDLSGHRGLARELAVTASTKLQIPIFKLSEGQQDKASERISIKIENPDDCARYSARVITGIKVGPSPKFVQERLKVLGLRPINNIVDFTNFVMLETGQPLHAFDFNKLAERRGLHADRRGKIQRESVLSQRKSATIVVRRARKGERLKTLDGEEYALDPSILVIADARKAVALAGIKGGENSGIDEKTTTIVIESANFDPIVTRRASRKLGLRTDASLRFEHGLSPSMTIEALDIVAGLIQEHAGGNVLKGVADAYPNKEPAKIVEFDPDFTNQLLGTAVPKEKAVSFFSSLGFRQARSSSKKVVALEVPTVRRDIGLREDIIEEVGRLWGYEKIPETPLYGPHLPEERDEKLFWQERIVDFLVGMGLTEVQTYSFVSKVTLEHLKVPLSESLEVENSVSADYQYLRPSLVPNLLGVVAKNKNLKDDLRLFEMGTIFFDSRPSEISEVCVILALRQDCGHESFLSAKGILDGFFDRLGISDDWLDQAIPASRAQGWYYQMFHSFRRAEVKIGDKLVGIIGEVNPRVLKHFGIRGRVAAFSLQADKVAELATADHEFQEYSKFPAVVRDIAILVPQEVRVEQVTNVIEHNGGKFLVDVDLFDIYEGEHLEAEQKSLAFHLIFQSKERTLTDKEVDGTMVMIQKAVRRKGWETR